MKYGEGGDPFKDVLDAINKMAEEMNRTGRSFRDDPFDFRNSRAYSPDWSNMDDPTFRRNAYEKWIERFEINFRIEEKCYRVTDTKTKIWLDVPHSAVVEEIAGAVAGAIAEQRSHIKRRAGKIAHSIIRHKEKESKREETRLISVTYPAEGREPDFVSPSQEGQPEASDVHMLRASAGVPRR